MASYACPICGRTSETEECEHFVGEFDHTFGEIITNREAEELSSLEHSILAHFQKTKSLPLFKFPELKDLYSAWQKSGQLDRLIFLRLLTSLLRANTAQTPEWGKPENGASVDVGSPGFSSSSTILYAKNPREVVQRTIHQIHSALNLHG